MLSGISTVYGKELLLSKSPGGLQPYEAVKYGLGPDLFLQQDSKIHYWSPPLAAFLFCNATYIVDNTYSSNFTMAAYLLIDIWLGAGTSM